MVAREREVIKYACTVAQNMGRVVGVDVHPKIDRASFVDSDFMAAVTATAKYFIFEMPGSKKAWKRYLIG